MFSHFDILKCQFITPSAMERSVLGVSSLNWIRVFVHNNEYTEQRNNESWWCKIRSDIFRKIPVRASSRDLQLFDQKQGGGMRNVPITSEHQYALVNKRALPEKWINQSMPHTVKFEDFIALLSH